jgi:hypothetical protein
LIFGIWRNRRQEQDDELLSAYVDRRPGGEPEVELPERLRADAAGLAETAALLRSVERVPAPRSFALTPEMIQFPERPSFSERTGWSLALFRAPAIAAAAAAFVLGLLVIGNIAGVLEQDSTSSSSDASLAAPAVPADSASAAMAAPATGGAAEAANQNDAADTPVESAAAAASSVLPGEAVMPEAMDAQAAEPATVPEDSAMLDPAEGLYEAPADAGSMDAPPAAPETQAGDSGLAADVGAAGGPSLAAAPSAMEMQATDAVVDAAVDDSAAAELADRLEAGAADGTDADRLPEDLEKGLEPQDAEPAELPARAGGGLPLAGDTALPGDGESPRFDFGIAEDADDDGLTLPLWQLEVAFGLLALVLGGIAFALKRR